MKALITGATGFIGSAIVREMQKNKTNIRVLVRRKEDAQHYSKKGFDVSLGDILEKESLERAIKGCTHIFHTAAIYEFWVSDKKLLYRTATEGTKNVLDVAKRSNNIEKIIYTSSALTIGERRHVLGTELTNHRGYFLSTYEKAKFEAEQIALSFVGEGSPIVIVNPAAVYGPGDLKPTGRSIINALNGKFPGYIEATSSVVYVEDVAKAHVLLAKNGRVGERYIISGQIINISDSFSLIAEVNKRKVPQELPALGGWLMALLGEAVSLYTHKPPLLALDHLRHLLHGNQVDGSKFSTEYGLIYTTFKAGMNKTIEWYWNNGYLNIKPALLSD